MLLSLPCTGARHTLPGRTICPYNRHGQTTNLQAQGLTKTTALAGVLPEETLHFLAGSSLPAIALQAGWFILMAIDRAKLEASLQAVQLPPEAAEQFNGGPPLVGPIHVFETLASTNETLWQLLDRGATPGTIAIASQQTAGRGQWGRTWISTSGGLYLSLALAPDLAAENSTHLTLGIAWGIAAELRRWHIPVQIKWPNDLVLCQRKLGGILTETRIRNSKIATAVVGVGINWSNPVPETGIALKRFLADLPTDDPPDTEPPVAGKGVADRTLALERHHTPQLNSLETVAAIAIAGIRSGFDRVQQEGIETLLPHYTSLLNNLGHLVQVDGRPGHIVGVSAAGDLLVQFESAFPALRAEQSLGSPSNPLAIVPPQTAVAFKPGTIQLGYR